MITSKPILGVINPTGLIPCFAIPVFGKPGRAYVQSVNADDRIECYEKVTLPPVGFVKIRSAKVGRVGAPALYGFVFSETEHVVGTKEELRAILISRESLFTNRHFLRMDIDDFVGRASKMASVTKAFDTYQTVKPSAAEAALGTVQETGTRIEMENGLLTVSFSLSAEPGPLVPQGANRLYAGSAKSVRYRDDRGHVIELLDVFRHCLVNLGSWIGHDSEKRCMQIARLTLFDSRLGTDGYVQVTTFDRDYNSVAITHDATECSMLVQCPIVLRMEGLMPDGRSVPQYYLNRRLTFKKLASHVFEHISVNRADAQGNPQEPPQDIDFAATFFSHFDFGLSPRMAKDLTNGRFSIACAMDHLYAPHLAYGFACSRGTSISHFENPVPSYPHPSGAHKSFAWRTGRRRGLQVVHLFTFGSETDNDGSLLRQLQPE